MSQQEPRPEAEIATPPRGIAEVNAPDPQVWGEAVPPAPVRSPQQRRARIWLAAQVAVLVVGLLATAWIATDYARTTWRTNQPSQPAAVDQSGAASMHGITVSLVEATDLGDSPSLPGSDWQPPAGFHAWRVVLATESTHEGAVSCDALLVDAQGRQFYANYFVDNFVDGYEFRYACAAPGPSDEIPPEQALLVLVPADAEPVSVHVIASSLNPDYIELPIP
ncbi:hypothetical protein [Pseudactinotalea sp.]|uniref:hypothetical protein n=1 Tax=Pseudactinotalea sp. TaxID=1926260 RepID=UPI003B3ACF34